MDGVKSQRVVALVGFEAVAIPKPGISINDAMDRWCAAGAGNRVLDDGGRHDPRLLVARQREQMVLYEVEGASIEDAAQHMRNLGMDVRGAGPQSGRGLPTLVVSEHSDGFNRSK